MTAIYPGAATTTCEGFSTRRRQSSSPLTGSSIDSNLRTWGLKLRERVGFKRIAVAVARKLAVIMHSMLKAGELFDRNAGATT